MTCLFCGIIKGEIPANIVYQDDEVLAFRDIHPQAPQHILIVPRAHIASLNELTEQNAYLVGKLALTAQTLAKTYAIDQTGYRTVINCGAEAGQTVFHLHMHLLGGRVCTWPPG